MKMQVILTKNIFKTKKMFSYFVSSDLFLVVMFIIISVIYI